MRTFVLSVSTMVGTIIGAGIFGIPYVISKSGVIPGVFFFILLGGVVTLLHLLYGEICLRTSEKHRIVGYAKIYLGGWGKAIASLSLIVVLGGTLLAYLILAGEFLSIIFSSVLPVSSTVFSLFFLMVCGACIAKGRQLITKAELLLNLGLIGAVAVILFLSFFRIHATNFQFLNVDSAFLPYGVILFTLIGWEAIPEIASFLKDTQSRVRLEKVIITATGIATILSFVFAFAVLGVSGSATSSNAFSGFIPILGERIAAVVVMFGVFAITSSFLVLGNYLKNSLRHDFGIPTFPSVFMTLALPLIPFLLGVREFIGVIGTIGVLIGVLEGLMIIRIFQKAKIKGDRVPEYSLNIPSFVLSIVMYVLITGGVAALLF